jgi:Family of unknown function (DUF6807)
MKLTLTCLVLAACAAPQRVDAVSSPTRHTIWAERKPGKLIVRRGEALFTELRFEDGAYPYLYPVNAPGGVPVTRGFPMDPREGESSDHPHHRSMWFTHGSVNGIDFWHPQSDNGGVIVRVGKFEQVLHRGKTLNAAYDFEWRPKAGGPALLRERRSFTFGIGPEERWIDVHVSLTPAGTVDVTFGDTKEGSFGMRLHPVLRLEGKQAHGQAINSEGITGKAVWGKRATWVHYQAPDVPSPVGVALFEHPTNPRHPTWWHARAYGLVAANPFGVHDFEGKPPSTGDFVLPVGTVLDLRYRVWIHTGERSPQQVAAAYGSYLAQTSLK